jgi:uridylate kinase
MARRSRVAVSTGGSIVAPEPLDPAFVGELASVLGEAATDRDLLVVVGGGRTARRYIAACRELGADEAYLDLVGIDCTRLNARLLVSALGDGAFRGVPTTVQEALEASTDHRIVVMGGTIPGQTTDAVTAELAALAGAKEMVVLTNVDGVYTADPRHHPEAERLTSITTSRLLEIVDVEGYQAGSSTVVDPVAARVVHRAGITTRVLDGRDLEQVRLALVGGDFHGTTVHPDGEA